MKLQDMKIRRRLIFGFFTPYLMSAVVLVMCIFSMLNMKADYERIIEKNIKLETQVLNTRIYLNTAARYVRDLTLDKDKLNYSNNLNTLNDMLDTLHSSTEMIQKDYKEDISDGLGAEFITGIQNWEAMIPEILSAIERNDFDQAQKLLVGSCTPALNAQAQVGREFAKTIDQEVQKVLETQDRISAMAIGIGVILVIVITILTMIISSRVIKSLILPLRELKEAIIAFSQGKFDVPVLYQSKDEVSEMAEAVRTSQEVLQTVIAEIDRTTSAMAAGNFNIKVETEFPGTLEAISNSIDSVVSNLSGTINEIKHTVDKVSMSAEQVASGSQSLAQGATQQASAVQELSATLTDISEMSRENAESAKTAKDNTDKASEQNVINKEKMHEMIQAMDNITSASQEIRKIIKTIEDIAFQTNILALNAAVEAARAGSAGKGFAVVADEVRNLASKSAEAAKNTTKLIADSIQAVEHGSEIAYSAAESIESSVILTGQAVEQITLIATAVEREAEAIRQITQGIDQIATVVQTNSATSEESAAASQELSTQANMMHAVLSNFKTEEDGAYAGVDTQYARQMGASGVAGYAPQPSMSYTNQNTYQTYDDKYAPMVATPAPVIKNASIKHYEVTPDIATGNTLIDTEHEQLFDVINDLLDACTSGTGRKHIEQTVTFLANYVDKHFGDEEQLQKQYAYPNYEGHKKFHTAYKADIRQMEAEVKQNGATLQTLSHVTDLANRLVGHIRQEDKRLAAHIHAQEQQ